MRPAGSGRALLADRDGPNAVDDLAAGFGVRAPIRASSRPSRGSASTSAAPYSNRRTYAIGVS